MTSQITPTFHIAPTFPIFANFLEKKISTKTKVQDHTNKTISKIIINLPISLLNFIVCFYNSLCVKTLISSYIFRIKINIPSSVSFKLTVRYELHQRIASHFNYNVFILHSFLSLFTSFLLKLTY